VQYWELSVTPGADRCDYSGKYIYQFQPVCQPSVLAIDSTCQGPLLNVTATLETSNYCGDLMPLIIGVAGNVTTFSDPALLHEDTSFLVNDTLYAKLVIFDNPQATVSAVSIDSIIVESQDIHGGPNEIVLASGGVQVPETSNPLTIRDDLTMEAGTTEAYFSFKLTDIIFPLDNDESTTAYLKVVAAVTFANTNRRRLLSFEASLAPQELSRNNNLNQLTKLAKSRRASIEQLRQVAKDGKLDSADTAMVQLLLKQKGANNNDFSFIQTDPSSVMRADTPFVVKRRSGSVPL